MHTVDNLADVADTGTRCGVHFHYVNMAAFHDRCAMLASTARFCRWAAVPVGANAVHTFGDNACGRGFTRSADTRHYERLRNSVSGERILKRANHRVLADEIDKRLGPIFAGKDLVGGLICHAYFHDGFGLAVQTTDPSKLKPP